VNASPFFIAVAHRSCQGTNYNIFFIGIHKKTNIFKNGVTFSSSQAYYIY